MKRPDALGPVMLDVAGTRLTAEDRERLLHPLTGGVILFARNYESPDQLAALSAEIHALREPRLLIAVDHEGGRVQRFREGFTRIPPMRELGRVWDRNAGRARHLAQETGYVLAAELRACGVDFSFTPVLDLDYGESGVIGDRAFHREPQAVGELAHALAQGMRRAGMAAVGKHFPGHGHVRADSHLELPVDERGYADIRMNDLLPFAQLIDLGLAGVMPAHVLYPRVDSQPAGFSSVWLQRVLRGELRFSGIVFSDDLCMEGACVAGDVTGRARAALQAGCDMVLVCNRPQEADEVLAGLEWNTPAASLARMARMHGRLPGTSWVALREDVGYTRALRDLDGLGVREGDLPLGS